MKKYYSREHEWIEADGNTATVGITAHAAKQLGDIVFIEQKNTGDRFSAGDEMGVIESVKAASDMYAPLDCEITETNDVLRDSPSMLNESPEANGWIYRVKLSDPGQLDKLMDEKAYAEFTE